MAIGGLDALKEGPKLPKWENIWASVKLDPDWDLDYDFLVFRIELTVNSERLTSVIYQVAQDVKDFPDMYGFVLDAMCDDIDREIKKRFAS
jgi:hypothetical protein